MAKWYQVAAAVLGATLAPAAGVYVGTKLAQPAPQKAEVRQDDPRRALADDLNRAIAENRVALRDLDGNGSQELVYFPKKGPPAIFEQVNGEYNPDNPISRAVYDGAAKFGAALTGDYSELTKKTLLAALEQEIPIPLHPLVAYTAIQDPALAIVCGDKLIAASAASGLLAELYQTANVTDLVLSNPKAAAAAGLVMFGMRVLQYGNPAYTKMPEYAYWTKHYGPEWQDVGSIDDSGLVKVAPGHWVNISDKETLKAYEDLRNDPNVIWTAGGYVRLEHPVGVSAVDYFREQERKEARERVSAAQRAQFEHGVQQTCQRLSDQAQQWSQQAAQQAGQAQQQFDQWSRNVGKEAERVQIQINQQLQNWNEQMQRMFQKR